MGASFTIDTVRFVSSVTLTRPDDITAYSAGDAITDSVTAPSVLQFIGIGNENSQSVKIDHVTIAKSGINATQLELWLFGLVPAAVLDNLAFSLSDENNNQCIAVVQIPVPTTATLNSFYDSGNIDLNVRLADGSLTFFGLLKTADGFTPLAEETFVITLSGQVLT